MSPTILIATHDMYTQIEDEPLPWYLVNANVNPDTGAVLQYKDPIHSKDEKTRSLWKNGTSKEFGRLADRFLGKIDYSFYRFSMSSEDMTQFFTFVPFGIHECLSLKVIILFRCPPCWCLGMISHNDDEVFQTRDIPHTHIFEIASFGTYYWHL